MYTAAEAIAALQDEARKIINTNNIFTWYPALHDVYKRLPSHLQQDITVACALVDEDMNLAHTSERLFKSTPLFLAGGLPKEIRDNPEFLRRLLSTYDPKYVNRYFDLTKWRENFYEQTKEMIEYDCWRYIPEEIRQELGIKPKDSKDQMLKEFNDRIDTMKSKQVPSVLTLAFKWREDHDNTEQPHP